MSVSELQMRVRGQLPPFSREGWGGFNSQHETSKLVRHCKRMPQQIKPILTEISKFAWLIKKFPSRGTIHRIVPLGRVLKREGTNFFPSKGWAKGGLIPSPRRIDLRAGEGAVV